MSDQLREARVSNYSHNIARGARKAMPISFGYDDLVEPDDQVGVVINAIVDWEND